jgi:hypothetical protein
LKLSHLTPQRSGVQSRQANAQENACLIFVHVRHNMGAHKRHERVVTGIAQIEDEVFFPAIRAMTGSTDLAGESLRGHAYATDLIAQPCRLKSPQIWSTMLASVS